MGQEQAPPLPNVFISRPVESGKVMPYLLSEDPGAAMKIAALLGPSGFGKTTLAKKICQEVGENFPGGIFWKELSENSDDLESYAEELLGNELNRLVVIDNLHTPEQLRPFVQSRSKLTILVTTQVRGALKPYVPKERIVNVAKMELDQAVELLVSSLENTAEVDLARVHLEELATDLGNWPVILNPVSRKLADCAEVSVTLLDAITVLRNDLRHHGLFTFDKDDAVKATIEVCLSLLGETDSLLYKSLAVFPKDISIPLATIEKYWTTSGWVEEAKTYEYCLRLWDASLLQSLSFGDEGALQLHNVFREYLVRTQHESLAERHGRLLNSYAPSPVRKAMPEDDYIWKYLVFHLIGAGADRKSELLDTIKDWDYLARKTLRSGPLSVESDLLDAEKLISGDKELQVLSRSFANSGHLFNRCRTTECISEDERINQAKIILFVRLSHLSELRTMADGLAESLKPPYIVPAPAFSLPDLPHPALIRTLEGHTSPIEDCTFSQDGERIVSSSSDGTVKIWKADGEILHSFTEHAAPVHNCAFIRNSKLIASASRDLTLKLWEADSGKIQHTHEGQFDIVLERAFSHDGRLIVSASPDGTLKVWETISGNPLYVLEGHPEIVRLEGDDDDVEKVVNSCVFSPDSKHLISASSAGMLRVWQAGSPSLVREFKGRLETVLNWGPDGKKIVSTSTEEGSELKVWNPESGDILFTLLKIWNPESGDILLTLKSGNPVTITDCAFSPDGRQLITASSDYALMVWDAENGKMLDTLEGHSNAVSTCAFSIDGKKVLSASSDGTLKIWDAALIGQSRSRSISVQGCAFSQDGRRIAAAFADGTLKVWDSQDGKLLETYVKHLGPVTGVSFGSEFIGSSSSDRSLKIWKANSEKPVRTLQTKIWKDEKTDEVWMDIKGHTDSVNSCAFSPDGKLIASASSDRTLKVWEIDPTSVRTLNGHSDSVLSCAFSPDGDRIVSASADGKLKVWSSRVEELVAEELLTTLDGHSKSVNSCAFGPYGDVIVSASDDCTLKIWGAYSGSVQTELVGHSAPVKGCGFSPDGELIVSTSVDRTLRVWDASSGRCLTIFHADGPMYCCAIFGEMIVAGGARGVYFLKLVRQIEEENNGSSAVAV
ncbi:MAG TPA: hypothetical protein PLD20_12625 [Blastocatellia bacterium]|nr:hypothetical protein [Blastocatellia bacterium]HMZ18772.1 hypothetical protein [Blastocatellia bacterium]